MCGPSATRVSAALPGPVLALGWVVAGREMNPMLLCVLRGLSCGDDSNPVRFPGLIWGIWGNEAVEQTRKGGVRRSWCSVARCCL